jgi:hypothetical protein
MPVCNDRGIVTKLAMMRTAIAMEELSKHFSAEMITCSNRRAIFCAIHAEGL